MANNAAVRSSDLLSAAANAITAMNNRNPAPQQRRWKDYWTRFWCFGPQKRPKRIVPASRVQEGNTIGNLPDEAQASGANQPATLTPLLLAPPSSPASLLNSGNPSSVPSPAGFVSSSCMSTNACSPGRPISNMFTPGPYAHETQLVSPPVFSSFTTEPSTASFTPPRELLHLTNPPSPEVPFAHLLASSSDSKVSSHENGITFSSFPFTSFGYGATNDLLSSYQLYPGSPVGNLLSPKSGVSGSGPSSPFPELDFPFQWKALHSVQDIFGLRNEPINLLNQERDSSRTSIISQDRDASFSATSLDFHLNHVHRPYQSVLGERGGELCNPTREEGVCCTSGENMVLERDMERDRCSTSEIHASGMDIVAKFPITSSKTEVEPLEANRASFELVSDEITIASGGLSEILVDKFPVSSFGEQKLFEEESSTSDKRHVKKEIHMAESALPN